MGFPKLGHQHDKKYASNSSVDRIFSDTSNDGLVELLIDIESPPCVLYGTATESTGALLSGLLKVRVKQPGDKISSSEPLSPVNSHGRKKKSSTGLNAISQTLSNLSLANANVSPVASPGISRTPSVIFTKALVKSVSLSLVQKVRYAKPFVAQCNSIQSCLNCRSKVTELARWDIVGKEVEIPLGDHAYPFSHLIPGSVPATVSLGAESHTEVKYELIGEVTYKSVHKHLTRGDPTSTVRLRLPVPVTRSILRGPDKNSLRIFPPTDLTATVVLPNIIYPKSTFPLELKLDGISSEGRRWRMRRLNWKIEEKGRIKLNACATHKSKLKQLEKETKNAETQRKNSRSKSVKRTHDAAPQVTTSVCTLEDALSMTNAPEDPDAVAEEAANSGENGQETEDAMIHPSDDAMRQARTAEQQRVREELYRQELSEGTALFTEELRTIAHGDVRNGWKSDFTGNGKIELVTEINCMGLNSGVSNPVNRASSSRPIFDNIKQPITVACDVEDPHLGIYVQHLLILEIIVAEEALQYANGQPLHSDHAQTTGSTPNASNPDQRLAELSPMLAARSSVPPSVNPEAQHNDSELTPQVSHGSGKGNNSRVVGVPTGAARVLRMQFRLSITERSGLGISWDDEVPPTYQDVRLLSPPSYNKVTSGSNTPQFNLPINSDDQLPASNYSSGRGDSHELSRPAQVHAHESQYHALSPMQSPQLENIVSIQGNAYPAQLLTPQTTQEIQLPSMSELLDTDRITQ